MKRIPKRIRHKPWCAIHLPSIAVTAGTRTTTAIADRTARGGHGHWPAAALRRSWKMRESTALSDTQKSTR
jgi:hypothetical protein